MGRSTALIRRVEDGMGPHRVASVVAFESQDGKSTAGDIAVYQSPGYRLKGTGSKSQIVSIEVLDQS